MAIGKCRVLQQEAIRAALPTNYSIVYELSKLDEKDINKAVTEGVVNPAATREEITDWINEHGLAKAKSKGQSKTHVVYATLELPTDYDAEKKEKLQTKLELLKAEFKVDVKLRKSPAEAKYERAYEAILNYVRRRAREYIHAMKARRFAGKKHLSKAAKKRLWNYGEDEVGIPADATMEQVQYALNTVGSDDRFQEFYEEALDACEIPSGAIGDQHEVSGKEAEEDLGQIMVRWKELDQMGSRTKKINLEAYKDFK